MTTVAYGSLFMDRGERWPKVAEQIDSLAEAVPGGTLYFDIFVLLADQDEAIAIGERTFQYAIEAGMEMVNLPAISVRMPDGKSIILDSRVEE